ncbi:phosphopantothenoylcysteine decarboxylase [Streptococcus sciuri]|uniref:Phosphopantothenoylcysteine decarboxylase n=1 Tax=Streptococcus sciuri TaxID=2973939 RepID=A0ABT2F5F1_9STRE|nr:phosphopantothenoylcysteine decarboxylase [Streptococcus sciuri]MCS4487683.1 phosphopantothenoylcysteine decarboxylase [Streptococcus sciuri]
MTKKKIILAVSGSISAYKSADLANQLTQSGYDVQVLMTQAASQFITPLTLQVLSKNTVHMNLMTEENPKVINHIDLAKSCDLFLLAPASANTIAHLAHGFADNIVTATALALSQNVPKILAPAMNTKMYDNPITQANLSLLKQAGFCEIKPRESLLACGDVGRGALAHLEVIIQTINDTLH